MPARSKSVRWLEAIEQPAELLELVCDSIEAGESITTVCAKLGATRAMLYRWMQADPAREAAFRESRTRAAQAYDEQALKLILSAKTPMQLAIAREAAQHLRWRAKAVAPKEYGDRVELGGEIGVRNTPTEQLMAEATRLMRGLGLAGALPLLEREPANQAQALPGAESAPGARVA